MTVEEEMKELDKEILKDRKERDALIHRSGGKVSENLLLRDYFAAKVMEASRRTGEEIVKAYSQLSIQEFQSIHDNLELSVRHKIKVKLRAIIADMKFLDIDQLELIGPDEEECELEGDK